MTDSSSTRRMIARLVTAVVAVLVLLPVFGPANAAPRAPRFGRIIEDYPSYVPQSKCRPKPKAGVVAFRAMVLAEYPDTSDFGISRKCNVGGTSEHKEGRAWDWGVDATTKRGRRTARDLLKWMFATDRHGNEHAIARRLGIMYIVWNRRIWGSWNRGWETYCIQRKHKCKSPKSGAALHPHTDHMHISFSRRGARKQTSFWNPELSKP